MKLVTKHEIFNDFAWLLEITDMQLTLLKANPERINTDMELMKAMMKAKGNNAHILQLTLCGDIGIVGHIERLLTMYDSVSWVHNDKFYLKKGLLCHQ